MKPALFLAVINIVPALGAVGFIAGLLLNEELERLANFPGPNHVRVSAFALAAESIENRLWVGFGYFRVQLS